MKHTHINARKGGFSLVEMLVVIAVIGILAAIAVPNISRINDASEQATYRRNAQNIASVFAAGQAAGHDWGGSTDEATLIGAVVTGHTITDTNSPFQGTYFGVPSLGTPDIGDDTTGIMQYLDVVTDTVGTITTTRLVYTANVDA